VIENLLGIELSNIELVGLKIIVEEVSEEIRKNNEGLKSHYSRVNPQTEIPMRFLYKFMGSSQLIT